MSILRLTFLGTSAAAPTLHRNVSGLAVKANTDLLLFDCGEGSQRQMIRFGTGFSVDAAFFTHFHADHYLGIIGFLRTLGMGGRTESLTLSGPPPARRILDEAIHLGVERLAFPVDIQELRGGEVLARAGYTVRPIRVDHRVNALGYVIEEDVRPGRFDPGARSSFRETPAPAPRSSTPRRTPTCWCTKPPSATTSKPARSRRAIRPPAKPAEWHAKPT